MAAFRLLFFAAFLVDFLALLADFFAAFLLALRADFRGVAAGADELFVRVADGLGLAGVGAAGAAGVGVGGYSVGSGSIQPDPDQPISI